MRARALIVLVLLATACRARTMAPAARPLPSAPQRAPSGRLPVAVSPQALLRPGAITDLQRRLVRVGLLGERDVSGRLDGPTEVALRALQRRERLPETGFPTYETCERLGLGPARLFHTAESVSGAPRGG